MVRLKAIFVLSEDARSLIYGPDEVRDVEQRVDLVAPAQTRESISLRPGMLRDIDVLFSGWGAPLIDEAFLAAAPKLQAVFYGAGSVASVVTPAVWERGIVVTSANSANAVPVAEYALSMILFSLKHGWRLIRETRQQRRFVDRNGAPGCYGTTVGIVSLGAAGRVLANLLKPFDLNVLVYDPFVSESDAADLGVELVSLADLFRRADVVSLHAPLLPETEGMIGYEHLSTMRAGAALINTARGEIIHQSELIDVARLRPDLQFVLDVVYPEPLPTESPLYDLVNVVLTPHIAGSAGQECRRMGRYMVEELDRFITGQPLKWAVTPESAMNSSHRPIAVRRANAQHTSNRIASASVAVMQ
jgi:phosphoglycerate dehydrogenase-like enzyme